MDLKELDRRYGGAPIAWAVVDVLQDYLERRDPSIPITLEEIRSRIFECEFEPGLPELHRELAERDDGFVHYLFELAKAELDSDEFAFTKIDSSMWLIRRRGSEE